MEQRSPEWFEARKKRVTGSMVGAILGLNPYMTPEDAMRSMVREAHGAEREFSGNVATEYGTFHEAGAVQDFQMATGMKVEPAGFVTHGDWLGASPDGYVGAHGLIEVKCPYGQRDKEAPVFKSAKEQMHYWAQMQIQMFVTGRDHCWFWQWAPHGQVVERVEHDYEWVTQAVHELTGFYQQFLKELSNPAHLEPKVKELRSNDALAMSDEYDDVSDAIERLTARKKELLEKIVESAGGQNCIINGKRLTYVERPGSVSYAKAVKELCPDADLTKYTGKPSGHWRFS